MLLSKSGVKYDVNNKAAREYFITNSFNISDAIKITSTFESNIKGENCGSYFVTVTK